MNINKNNYEVYFLDYRENQLSPGEVADMMLFLENNPDLQREFDEFDNISLIPEQNIVFEPKATLKKQIIAEVEQINAENYEQYFIASVEKQLNSKEEADLNHFLNKNKFLLKEFELFKKSVLIPDRTVVYNDKSKLYKKAPIIIYSRRFVYYAASVAAIVLLFFSLYINNDSPGNNELPISKYDNENILIEENLTSKIDNVAGKVKELAQNDTPTSAESISKVNIVNVSGEINISYKPGRKPLTGTNFTKIKKIGSPSVQSGSLVADNFCFEQRTYIYDVFRGYKTDIAQNDYFEPEVKEDKTFLGYALSKITDIFRKNIDPASPDGNITFWDIADAGITGFNKVTQNDVQLTREYDQEGKLTSLALLSDGVEVYKRKPSVTK